MAFSDAQLVKLTRITGVDSVTLANVLNIYEAEITTEVETQAGALILEWFPVSGEGAGRDFVDVAPKERNFGADIKTDRLRAAIRKELGEILYLTDYMTSGSSSRLVRC